MRLAKYLAHAGVASRRAAQAIVVSGRVRVGGQTVRDPAWNVEDGDEIEVDGVAVRRGADRVVYALHKPAGVVSTARDTHGRRTVVDLVEADGRRLYPVGRLDIDSTGLILLTDDGDLAHRLTHPSFEVDKTYVAEVSGGPVGEPELRALAEGIELEDGPTAPAVVHALGPRTLSITIHEGRKRQVRRMCAAVGHPVRALTRVRMGPLELGDLAPAAFRRLDADEVSALAAAGTSARR